MIIGCFSDPEPSAIVSLQPGKLIHQTEGNEKLRTNILICQAAAKLSIFAGMISAIAGIIVVMMFKIGGDTAVVGQGIATALAGLFSAIKCRFLRQIKHRE